jgi:hypothetical protein
MSRAIARRFSRYRVSLCNCEYERRPGKQTPAGQRRVSRDRIMSNRQARWSRARRGTTSPRVVHRTSASARNDYVPAFALRQFIPLPVDARISHLAKDADSDSQNLMRSSVALRGVFSHGHNVAGIERRGRRARTSTHGGPATGTYSRVKSRCRDTRVHRVRPCLSPAAL